MSEVEWAKYMEDVMVGNMGSFGGRNEKRKTMKLYAINNLNSQNRRLQNL